MAYFRFDRFNHFVLHGGDRQSFDMPDAHVMQRQSDFKLETVIHAAEKSRLSPQAAQKAKHDYQVCCVRDSVSCDAT